MPVWSDRPRMAARMSSMDISDSSAIVETLAMASSNDDADTTEAVPRAVTPAVTVFVSFPPMSEMPFPYFSSFDPSFSAACSTFCMLFSAASVSMKIDPNSLKSSIYLTRLSLSRPPESPLQTVHPWPHVDSVPRRALA